MILSACGSFIGLVTEMKHMQPQAAWEFNFLVEEKRSLYKSLLSGILKHTRLRREALNVLYLLGRKLKGMLIDL